MKPFAAALVLAGLVLAACTPPDPGSGINDPHEAENRKVHAFNRKLDATLFGPVAERAGKAPGALVTTVDNFATNIDTPRVVVNDLLQLNLADAATNTLRFVMNSTLGLGGLFDPASEMGLYLRETDFGATLYHWGMPEGAYRELPFFGPSTDRDAAGLVVDFFLNPLSWTLPKKYRWLPPAALVERWAAARLRYGDAVTDLLQNSEDSYAQLRLLYLQNRRFKLRGDLGAEDYEDPYEE